MKNCEKCGYDKSIINITIRDFVGEITLCPNCLAVAFLNDKLHFVDNANLICDITGERGAVEFITCDEYYCLNSKAMMRLISHNLKPLEYFALAQKYGNHKFMIHDDFYDEDGFAIQPMG
jgi:hypothetical protein